MKTIKALNNPEIKFFNSLKNKKNILEHKLFLIEGKHLINEAMNAGIIQKLLIIDPTLFSEFSGEKILVNNKIIDKLSTNVNYELGAIAICHYYQEEFNLEELKKIVVLDSVNNPGNLGTIIRSTKAFGYEAIILLNNSVFPYNEKTIKASQGEIFNFKIKKIDQIEELNSFYPYYFVLEDNSIALNELKNKELDNKHALVFGNEARGISKDLREKWLGTLVKIEQNNNVESLNLAVSAGIALYFLRAK